MDNRSREWRLDKPVDRDQDQSWSNYLRGVSAHFVRNNISVAGMDIYAEGNTSTTPTKSRANTPSP